MIVNSSTRIFYAPLNTYIRTLDFVEVSFFSLPKCKVVFVRWYLTCKVVPYKKILVENERPYKKPCKVVPYKNTIGDGGSTAL